MRVLVMVLVVVIVISSPAFAQTETPTATPTVTPSPTGEPWLYITMQPASGTPEGQVTRFDYVVTAGDVQIANLLTFLLFSLWGMFLFAVIVLLARYRK